MASFSIYLLKPRLLSVIYEEIDNAENTARNSLVNLVSETTVNDFHANFISSYIKHLIIRYNSVTLVHKELTSNWTNYELLHLVILLVGSSLLYFVNQF